MKILGWILLIAGLVFAYGTWSSGWVMRIISIAIALIGLWLAMKKQSSAMMPPMPPQM
jgi:hypothetical protein